MGTSFSLRQSQTRLALIEIRVAQFLFNDVLFKQGTIFFTFAPCLPTATLLTTGLTSTSLLAQP